MHRHTLPNQTQEPTSAAVALAAQGQRRCADVQAAIYRIPADWRKPVVMLGISCAFGVAGWWLWTRGSGAWWIAMLFLLGVPVALVQLLPGSTYVEVRPDGLVSCQLFRRHVTPWSDIERFLVTSISGHTAVGIVYKPGAAKPRLRSVARTLTGVEGILPLGIRDPGSLVHQLNAPLIR